MVIPRIQLILILLLFSCSSSNTQEENSELASPANELILSAGEIEQNGIVTQIPEVRELIRTVSLNGYIEVPPANIASVTIPLGGYIKSMNLVAGQKVKKGETLAVIEDQQYIQLQQDYLITKSKLAFLDVDVQRQQTLNSEKISSDKIFQQVSSEHTSQKVLLKALAEKLRLFNIDPDKLSEATITRSIALRSPFDGYVSSIHVNAGKYVNPTDVLFQLIDPSRMILKLNAFERDLSLLDNGDSVKFKLNSSDKIYHATVFMINRSIGEERVSEVYCAIGSDHKKLSPGMFANAEVEVTRESTSALPEDAVVKWEKQDYVFIATKNNGFKMIPVEVGNVSQGYVPLYTILPADTRVVTQNAYTLLMKLKVDN